MSEARQPSGTTADVASLFGTATVSAILAMPLPPGEILTEQSTRTGAGGPPLCWISAEVPSPQLLAAARADYRRTGLFPVLVCDNDEMYGERCTVGVLSPEPQGNIAGWDSADIMRRIWNGLVQADDEFGPAYDSETLAPFGDTFPGPAAPGGLLADPDILANQQVRHYIDEDTRLALVPTRRGADVLTVLGWSGAANHLSLTSALSSVVRSWEDRFGARVIRLGPDRLDISVSAPPHEPSQAAIVAAEHWTFCPDSVLGEWETLRDYAQHIQGRRIWSFWWE